MLRNLAYRESEQISVSLDWRDDTGKVYVTLLDSSADLGFTLEIPAAHALDAFYHPFVYHRAMKGSDVVTFSVS